MGVGCVDLLIILETFLLTIIVSISLKNTVLCGELLLRVMLEQLYGISRSDTYNLEWTKYTNQLILDFGEKHCKTVISERSKMMRWALWCPQVSSWRYFLRLWCKEGEPNANHNGLPKLKKHWSELGEDWATRTCGVKWKEKKTIQRNIPPNLHRVLSLW